MEWVDLFILPIFGICRSTWSPKALNSGGFIIFSGDEEAIGETR